MEHSRQIRILLMNEMEKLEKTLFRLEQGQSQVVWSALLYLLLHWWSINFFNLKLGTGGGGYSSVVECILSIDEAQIKSSVWTHTHTT